MAFKSVRSLKFEVRSCLRITSKFKLQPSKIVLPVLMSISIIACTPKESEYPTSDEVPGIYVNEYSADVADPDEGEVIGNRTVRDSIFIKHEGDYFRVSNRKWLMNDYDGKGWVDSLQGERKPMETYDAAYDPKPGLLSPLIENSAAPLFIEDEKMFWGEVRALEYLKVSSF
jgi:hypothetical protein